MGQSINTSKIGESLGDIYKHPRFKGEITENIDNFSRADLKFAKILLVIDELCSKKENFYLLPVFEPDKQSVRFCFRLPHHDRNFLKKIVDDKKWDQKSQKNNTPKSFALTLVGTQLEGSNAGNYNVFFKPILQFLISSIIDQACFRQDVCKNMKDAVMDEKGLNTRPIDQQEKVISVCKSQGESSTSTLERFSAVSLGSDSDKKMTRHEEITRDFITMLSEEHSSDKGSKNPQEQFIDILLSISDACHVEGARLPKLNDAKDSYTVSLCKPEKILGLVTLITGSNQGILNVSKVIYALLICQQNSDTYATNDHAPVSRDLNIDQKKTPKSSDCKTEVIILKFLLKEALQLVNFPENEEKEYIERQLEGDDIQLPKSENSKRKKWKMPTTDFTDFIIVKRYNHALLLPSSPDLTVTVPFIMIKVSLDFLISICSDIALIERDEASSLIQQNINHFNEAKQQVCKMTLASKQADELKKLILDPLSTIENFLSDIFEIPVEKPDSILTLRASFIDSMCAVHASLRELDQHRQKR